MVEKSARLGMICLALPAGFVAAIALAASPPRLIPVPESPELRRALAAEIIGPRKTLEELRAFLEPRIPKIPAANTVAEWEPIAAKIRTDILEKVVFRGEAARWRDAPLAVEWMGELEGGAGYRIRKLRYEAVPGLWIPALLYLPAKVE